MLNLKNIKSLENEDWKPVDSFEGAYWVSNKGRITNGKTILRGFINNSGYHCIDLHIHGNRSRTLVHRLVAMAFHSNTDNLPEVNHIDENKLNNTKENLEWCTISHNKRHSMASGAYDAIYTTRNSLGKKHLPDTTSTFHNVYYDKRRDKWVGGINHQGKILERKRFNTELDAAAHVNYIIDKYGLHDRSRNIF